MMSKFSSMYLIVFLIFIYYFFFFFLGAQVVASMDWPEVTKYRGLVSAQAHREEIIEDLYKKYQDPKGGLVHGGMIR